MKFIEKNTNIQLDSSVYLKTDLSESLFFDIETTGFSSKHTYLYLIGCIAYNNKTSSFISYQWLIEDKSEESIIINEFFQFAKQYTTIVHFNGEGFDIPYIESKCAKYSLDYSFSTFKSIDLYKEIAPIKNIFKLENIKQKSLQSFLDIDRDDKYNGGELISVFMEYAKNKDHKLEDLLLLHNYEDICGLIQILPLLNYKSVFDGHFKMSNIVINKMDVGSEVFIECICDYTMPKRISYGNSTFYFTAFNNKLKFKVSMYSGGLKYFYPNYKDYYYLPKEDCSIHKSVAFYVDKDFRTKAKAQNCYSKKTGRFLPQHSKIISPYFKLDYNDDITYFELTEDILENCQVLKPYCIDILEVLKKFK